MITNHNIPPMIHIDCGMLWLVIMVMIAYHDWLSLTMVRELIMG